MNTHDFTIEFFPENFKKHDFCDIEKFGKLSDGGFSVRVKDPLFTLETAKDFLQIKGLGENKTNYRLEKSVKDLDQLKIDLEKIKSSPHENEFNSGSLKFIHITSDYNRELISDIFSGIIEFLSKEVELKSDIDIDLFPVKPKEYIISELTNNDNENVFSFIIDTDEDSFKIYTNEEKNDTYLFVLKTKEGLRKVKQLLYDIKISDEIPRKATYQKLVRGEFQELDIVEMKSDWQRLFLLKLIGEVVKELESVPNLPKKIKKSEIVEVDNGFI